MLPFEFVCPYCHADAELVSGSVVYPHRPDLHQNQFWQCAPCNAYIRCHEGTSQTGNGALGCTDKRVCVCVQTYV